jgi:hypothetical protein
MSDPHLAKISVIHPNDPWRRQFVGKPMQKLQFGCARAVPRLPCYKRSMDRATIGKSMANGYDERCAADLSNVVEGRRLSRENAAWLARAVTGAIRPNRDKPFWDIAHAVVAIGGKGSARTILDIALDPRLVAPEAIARHLSSIVPPERRDERGLLLPAGDRLWKGSWIGLARLLALAEFVLTMEDLAAFREVSGWLDEALALPHDIDLLVTRLVRRINLYRQAHVPLARVEKRFRAILMFLGESRGGHVRGGDTFDDDDILAFWRAEITAGERPQFRTILDHFITFEKAASILRGLRGVTEAMSLEAIEDWGERLDAMLGDLTTSDDAAVTLAESLGAMPESPKILTGVERDDLIDIVSLEPFHKTRPLSVLRAVSFGRVQSGIANRLRRHGGGGAISERVDCADAKNYTDVLARADALKTHLGRMIRIAATLRFGGKSFDDPAVAKLLAAAQADIGRIRRAGFDDREDLAAAFAKVDETLISVTDEIEHFRLAAAKPVDGRLPADRFPEDRAFFSCALTDAYLAMEHADDDGTGRTAS